jgi:hypothetical protein
MSSLETVWEQREAAVYPELFGPLSRGIFVLSSEMFTQVFRQSEIDPRWLHHGVLEFGPTPTRSSWLYVTSGTSNPWDQDPAEYDLDAYSGLGSELVLEVPHQANWAIACLQKLLAYNILLAHGRFGGAEPLDYGDRLPLGGSIDGEATSLIRFVVVAKPSHFPSSFSLDSGQVDLLQLVGITEGERDFAKHEGHDALVERLRVRGAFPLTDPERASSA